MSAPAGFVSQRPSSVRGTLAANYTFTASDAGVYTFTNAFILKKNGTRTLTVTDIVNGALTATDSIGVS